jgi:cyclic dehypoxanthinyl futalosine synthase
MRITPQQALSLLRGNDLLQLGMDADDVRQSLWPEGVVTYTVGYPLALGRGVALDEVAAAIERGATSLVLSAAPGASLSNVAEDMTGIRRRFPDLALTGLSSNDIVALGDPPLVFADLKTSGLSLFSGSFDAKIHRAAHQAGIPSVAVLELRSTDTPEDWVALLEAVAALQREALQAGTAAFLAVEPRIQHLERTLDEVTGAQYLKMVALCRLYLDTIPHLQVDWSIFGPKVLQVALRFGADDAGLVVASPRDRKVPSHHSGEEELRRIIRDAGFTPSQRDAVYGRQFVY